MYVHASCFYPAKSNVRNKCQILLKSTEPSVVLIVLLDVIYHGHVYTVTVFYRMLYMHRVPEKHTFGPWLNNTEMFFFSPFIVLKITRLQDTAWWVKKGRWSSDLHTDEHRRQIWHIQYDNGISITGTNNNCALFIGKCEKGNIWEEQFFLECRIRRIHSHVVG